MALLGNIPGEEGQEKNTTLWHFFYGRYDLAPGI